LARIASRLGLLDIPNSRSAHRQVTPRGGGIGIAAGVLAGFLVLTGMGVSLASPVLTVLAGAAVLAVLGLLDDFRSIPARYRLGVQALAAMGVVYELGGIPKLPLPPPIDVNMAWFGAPLAVLWLMTLTNFFNFMDGLDGLAGGQAVASSAGIAVAGLALGATQFAIILAGASVGFLILNIPPARIFLGDVGSTALGFSIGALPLLAPPAERNRAILAVMIGLALFLLDPIETLLQRIRRGNRLGVAHRDHSYQRIARAAGRHWPVSASLVLCGLVLAIGAGLSFRAQGPTWLLLALAAAAFGGERLIANRVADVGQGE
jgi:Fuc2NAc and GlcNAc transferase